MNASEKLLALFENDTCDRETCLELIKEIGGCTQIIEDKYSLKTTPLHEAVSHGHYDLALELVGEEGADLDVDPDGWGCLMWELQYIDSETREEQAAESESKLRLVLALINAGADPNPKADGDGESLLSFIRYKLNEGEGDHHIWEMEHIIDACAYGETERFLTKLKEQSVSRIMLSDLGFWLIDDNLCDCDHAVFVFEDGERMALSSYKVGDDEWDFYAVPVREGITLDPSRYHTIVANNNETIKYLSMYDECSHMSHWLDLSIDDAVLRIHADEPDLAVGIVSHDTKDWGETTRQALFIKTDEQ